MFWLSKKKASATSEDKISELINHKDIRKAAASRAKNANANLYKVVENNGFTLILAAAMGAKHVRGGAKGGH